MLRIFSLSRTVWRLGVVSVFRVILFRGLCKSGFYQWRAPVKLWTGGNEFFQLRSTERPGISQAGATEIANRGQKVLAGEFSFFGGERQSFGTSPDWFVDPIAGERIAANGHWSRVNEFQGSDIKCVWEISRCHWALELAMAARLSGGAEYVERLNKLLGEWCVANPANQGVNWKCAQECSIRMITVLLAAHVIGCDEEPSQDLIDFVQIHCERIALTTGYAQAQKNNHIVSEATALFIGGAWLQSLNRGGLTTSEARTVWVSRGRSLLQRYVRALVGEDGTFSQYSTNYHRVLVSSLVQAEFWRAKLGQAKFSSQMYSRAILAIEWLVSMTDPESGDVPNIGANDGANVYDVSASSYRDFRPQVQAASLLFQHKRAFIEGQCDDACTWLGIDTGVAYEPKQQASRLMNDGGFVVLNTAETRCVLRCANHSFRPSHADCLHLDIWRNGKNVARDGGTFSYNVDAKWLDYFSGTESHNTIQFDGRNQMPRLSRFLFSDWISMLQDPQLENVGTEVTCSAAYRDRCGAKHERSISVRAESVIIRDHVSGIKNTATMRWRLMPANWQQVDDEFIASIAKIRIRSEGEAIRCELTTGWESRYYMKRTELPVVEVHLAGPVCEIETLIEFLE